MILAELNSGTFLLAVHVYKTPSESYMTLLFLMSFTSILLLRFSCFFSFTVIMMTPPFSFSFKIYITTMCMLCVHKSGYIDIKRSTWFHSENPDWLEQQKHKLISCAHESIP